MIGLTIDFKGLDTFRNDLDKLVKRALPYAARETVNTLAFEGRRIWQDEMASSLTIRNAFTQRRALVERARTTNIDAMEARLGHTEEYMRRLEFGEPERAEKHWRPIPTEIASGEGKGALSGGRKKAVRRPNIITALGSLKGKSFAGRPRKARNARAIAQALKSGKRLALLDMGRRKGIYRVKGSKRRPELLKLYDLSRRVTPMPRIPTLQRTMGKTSPLGPQVAYRALLKQLRRAGVKGY